MEPVAGIGSMVSSPLSECETALLPCEGGGGRFRSDVGEFKDSVSMGSNLAQVYLWSFPFKQDLQGISVLCWSTPGFQPWGRVRVSTEMDFRNFIQYLLIHYFIPGILLGTRKEDGVNKTQYLPSRISQVHKRMQMCEHMNTVIDYA